jgi:hypothetical protein
MSFGNVNGKGIYAFVKPILWHGNASAVAGVCEMMAIESICMTSYNTNVDLLNLLCNEEK